MKVVLLALMVLGVGLLSTACEFSVSTANLSDVKSCVTPSDDSGLCEDDTDVFSPDVPQIAVTTELNNAPDGTELTFLWRYLEGDGVDIDSVTVVSEDGTNTAQSSLPAPDTGWPLGDYEVELDLGTDNSEPVIHSFSIEE